MTIPAPSTILKFVLAAAVGSGATLGIAGAVQASPKSTAVAGPANLYTAETPGGGPISFGLVPNPPAGAQPLSNPPADQGIQLISFTSNPVPPNAGPDFRPAWWTSAGYPRVPPVSQFDGGPLQSKNCTLAAGAMLARLGFGIVTTGSQLRSLQSNQVAGTTLGNLDQALQTGWSVQFPAAALTPLQLRALLYAGAGAVVQGIYADIPENLRLQKDFVGAHAIYLDGFRPPSGSDPAAYYVLDPIGSPWAGYHGDWWPADVVERFGTDFGGGSIFTAWSFAGGSTPPAHFPPLPPEAFPSGSSGGPTPTPSQSLSPSPAASASATPGPSAPPVLVPLPTPLVSPPSQSAGDTGPTVPPEVSSLVKIVASQGISSIVATLGLCLTDPPPAGCPQGIPAIYPSGLEPVIGPPPAPPPIDLLYASVPQPGEVQVIFSAPGSASTFTLWPTNGSGPAAPAGSLAQATLGGTRVWIATFPAQAGSSYEFVAGTAGAGLSGISQIGSVQVGP